MLFGKKSVASKEDPRMIELEKAMQNACISLKAAVKRAIIKQGVVTLYPVGPDKDVAQREAEAAKRFLLCCIGAYDARRQELADYAEKNNTGCIAATSHDIIEKAYEEFYKKA